jgi:phage shock protein A
MALITRLSRLFQADMNAVLDKIEEPGLLLKQAIRDMEESIALDDRQLRLWEFEQQQLNNRINELSQSLTESDNKIMLCFKSDKDDLARAMLRQKLEAQQVLKSLTGKMTVMKEKAGRLATQLAEHKTQLAEMKQKAEIFMDENRVNPSNWENSLNTVRDEDIEIAFLAEKQKWRES